MNLAVNDRPQYGPGSWRVRRRTMFTVIAFCMAVIVWCLWRDMSTGVAERAVEFSFLTILGIVGSYVFGATWSDNYAASQQQQAPPYGPPANFQGGA